MYYEKYEAEFQNSDLSKKYPKHILSNLKEYIKEELCNGYEYINPYKFALDYGLTDEESLQLFLFLTDDDKLFKVEPFVDCPICTGKRLSLLPENHIDENVIYCDDCNKEYQLSNMKNSLYFYFRLNKLLIVSQDERISEDFDPHSSFEIWKRLNGNLKGKSPSSSAAKLSDNFSNDEGDKKQVPGVTLEELVKNNSDNKGKQISDSTHELTNNLMDLMSMDEAI
ncbi:hypothetical protein [Peribacillus muralis]|uniref:hypothetical protein n=1 Tax=Peribacillus muralis TaxID=264697 RepID=UPI00366F1C0B